MSMWWKPVAKSAVMSLVLAACANEQAAPIVPATSPDRVLKLNMPRSPDEPVVYRYAGESFTDPDLLLNKVWADSNREL